MGKRFTDTNKYKKPFVRSLPGAYKLLWDFLYHDCDHSGIWIVDFETAQIYLGRDMPVSRKIALDYFNGDDEIRVIELDGGKKWFLPTFIEFQYVKLTEKNRAHIPVISALRKYGLLDDDLNLITKKGDLGPLQGGKDKEQEKELVKEKEQEKGALENYDEWTNQIIDGNDNFFINMFRNEGLQPGDHVQHWVLDHRDLLNRYPKMRPPTQDAFRKSCIKHIRENYKKPINGTGQAASKRDIDANARRAAFAKRHGTGAG